MSKQATPKDLLLRFGHHRCSLSKTVAMISIEQWRARIGLFNNKRGRSGFASLLFSPVFFHYCYRKNVRSREYSSTANTSPTSSSLPPAEEHPPTAHSTDLTSPAKSLNCSTTTSSSSSTTTTTSSSSYGGLFSLRCSLLRDVLIILLITIISQQLLMSGDIETNPGPRRGADDKPGLDDLLYMSYTGEDGRDVHFRLMDQLSPHWRRLAIALKFPQHEVAIMENKNDPMYYLLSEWLRGANQEKDPRPVTWRTLIKGLRRANVQEEATVLEKHFIEISVTVPNPGVELHFTDNATQNKDSYSTLLKQVYQAPPPTWDPLPQCGHIKLAMIGEKGKRRGIVDEEMIKHQMEGAVKTIMASKVPIDKDKIFDSGLFEQERQVILVEGPPGGGKTSLAYYYGQKWASGSLSIFDVVAFVRLRDLAVTPASTLPDLLLLACCATKDDTLITKEMTQQYAVSFPKLLLVLDGWDEAPNDIRNPSYVTNILRSISSQSKILITSRPDSSVDLHGLANRVEIVGFTEENIHEYFKEALSTELDHDKVEDGCRKLQEHFRSYPVIQSCCSIPLNAAILASLFLSEQSLPSTRHELFLMLVLSRINREQQDRHSQRHKEYVCVSSLDDLPHDLRVQLNHLCVLAFEGVKQNKVVFKEKDLVHKNSGLGVLQIVDRLVATGGKTAYRYFIHLSIQELLAAYHISQLGEDEQVKVFEVLLYEPRFSAVLQFYAAFTRLTNQGVRNIITTRNFDHMSDSSKLSLLSFIRCFFKAQIHNDTSLYQKIIPRLNGALNLYNVTMTPLDCMSIGYFMTSLLRAGGKVSLRLSRCSIDDYLLGLLLGEFSRHAEVCPAGVVQAAGVTRLDISVNRKITEIGIMHILRTNITNKLEANTCGISNMESLAKVLAVNSTLEELDISDNNIGDKGIGHIATALLTNTTLKILNISKCVSAVSSLLQRSDTGTNHMNGRVHICTALQKNTTLEKLNFSCCGLSDLVAESLARALEVNSSLKVLEVAENKIGDNGIAHIAKSLQKNNTLRLLFVGISGNDMLIPFNYVLTDTGVLSLARGVATSTSMVWLSIQWFSTYPDSTLKMMAESIKNSSLKALALSIHMQVPSGEVLTSRRAKEEKVKVWCRHVELGGNELILSLEDSRLESFVLTAPSLPSYGCTLQCKTAEDSVNSARHEKGLPKIDFIGTLAVLNNITRNL